MIDDLARCNDETGAVETEEDNDVKKKGGEVSEQKLERGGEDETQVIA